MLSDATGAFFYDEDLKLVDNLTGRACPVSLYSFVRFDFFTSVQQCVQLHLRFSLAQAMDKLSDVMELGA